MRIVVAGGSGFLGGPLIGRLAASGHQVTQLVRRPATKPEQVTWNPMEPVRLPDDTGAVINLCGAHIAHRWTDAYRRELYDSRVPPTANLARTVADQGIPLLLNASGVGAYGDHGDSEITEDTPPADPDDFLTKLSEKWEDATGAAVNAGARVVLLRTGLPLKRDGGFLSKQVLPFRLGLGGKLGGGRQWVPWIGFSDWIRAVEFIIGDAECHGPVNLVGPNPVTNADFTRALGRAVHRPTLMPIPKFALRLVFGEYAMEGYRSMRVIPKVLRDRGFTFEQSTVDSALKAALNA